MTVDDLYDRLDTVRQIGYGKSEVLAFDPEMEGWESVTCFTYATGDSTLKLYTDEP